MHYQKKHLQCPHRKLRFENAFEINLLLFLGVHPVFNVELLKPYFPPLLDIANVAEEINHTKLNIEAINPLQNDLS